VQQLNPTILLVEESRFFLTIEKQFLRNVPANLLEAQNAAQALATCRAEMPQLVYMSLDLAGEDGAACCRAIKSDNRLRNIPIILIHDSQRAEDAEVCRRAGCDAVLTKPLDRHHFLEIGRSFLAGIRERRCSCLIDVLAIGDGQQYHGKGLDISSGGFFFDTAEELQVGAVLQLELHLARPGEHGPRIRCTGTVAWINTRENPMKPNHPFGYGIKFTDIPIQYLGVLNGFLKALGK